MLSRTGLPDVPLLYLYGELTASTAYAPISEVAERYPKARLHCLAGQRHLAPMFDLATFVAAIVEFTAAVDERAADSRG